jgi:hypothetical protein
MNWTKVLIVTMAVLIAGTVFTSMDAEAGKRSSSLPNVGFYNSAEGQERTGDVWLLECEGVGWVTLTATGQGDEDGFSSLDPVMYQMPLGGNRIFDLADDNYLPRTEPKSAPRCGFAYPRLRLYCPTAAHAFRLVVTDFGTAGETCSGGGPYSLRDQGTRVKLTRMTHDEDVPDFMTLQFVPAPGTPSEPPEPPSDNRLSVSPVQATAASRLAEAIEKMHRGR